MSIKTICDGCSKEIAGEKPFTLTLKEVIRGTTVVDVLHFCGWGCLIDFEREQDG